MSNMLFSELELNPEILAAVDDMQFSETTEIQSKAIPLIRSGFDVIGRSQTGTGKTLAFAIPAIEKVEEDEWNPVVSVVILCPTRELAQQGCAELNKLTKYLRKIRIADIYGGVSMTRQFDKLKRANIVIGTPGRIMDHMRRGTLSLKNVKMIVLDEADEMLSMGFKEDIETILLDIPPERQTVLFSATMSPEIMAITKEFLKEPKLIEVDKKHITLDNIEQTFVDVPMGRKMDALNLLLRYYDPKLTMVFCNTKKMVDEVTAYLDQNGFNASGLHGDMNQMQRTSVMNSFKFGRTAILVATDVAARGIDVNDIDYVINYDIPQESEYYVHRIGRTGRAGKAGNALTICSGRKQIINLQGIAYSTKSKIEEISIPTVSKIKEKVLENGIIIVKDTIESGIEDKYFNTVSVLEENGISPETVAAAALKLHFSDIEINVADIIQEKRAVIKPRTDGAPKSYNDGSYKKILLSSGRNSRIAPNHIVGAITERTALTGKDIGKIEIYDDHSVVSVPGDRIDEVLEDLGGLKICGKPVIASYISENFDKNKASSEKRARYKRNDSAKRGRGAKSGGYSRERYGKPAAKRKIVSGK